MKNKKKESNKADCERKQKIRKNRSEEQKKESNKAACDGMQKLRKKKVKRSIRVLKKL